MSDPFQETPLARLDAYIDGQLDDVDRAEVEAWLARSPQEAAKVMDDLQLMNRLRVALAPLGADGTERHRAAAHRLNRLHLRHRLLQRLNLWVPSAALAMVVVISLAGIGPLAIKSLTASQVPPAFVQSAISAHETVKMRQPILSQPETVLIDFEELTAATGIILPKLPPSWVLQDAQIFPSADGPGIELFFQTKDFGPLTLFSVRPGDVAITTPISEDAAHGSIAWFRMGETAHVLVIDQRHTEALHLHANRLFDSLY